MYPRQFKQFLRTVQPDFDDRTFGSIAELMRACQKDGILRLERDRQGALRVFANAGPARPAVPHGWGLVVGRSNTADGPDAPDAPLAAEAEIEERNGTMAGAAEPEPIPVDLPADIDGNTMHDPKPKRASRARKAPAATDKRRSAAGTRKRKV